ncbi:MAG: hypothetical protein QXW98_08385 [Candidatus Caldarchaeum sp.]
MNTIISVLQKDGLTHGRDTRATRFVRLNAPFEQAVADPRYQRVITRTAAELWQSGLNEDGAYEGDKWGGKYLRAPDIYFTILEKGERYRVFYDQSAPVIVEIAMARMQE